MITKHQKSGNIITQIRNNSVYLPKLKSTICNSNLISYYHNISGVDKLMKYSRLALSYSSQKVIL